MLRHIAFALLSSLAVTSVMSTPPRCDADVYSADSDTQFDEGYLVGQAEALRDLRTNYLSVKSYGRELVWADLEEKILLRRFGIHVEWVAGCMVMPRQLGYAQGYNDVSEPGIQRRFGNALESASREAGLRWERARRKKT